MEHGRDIRTLPVQGNRGDLVLGLLVFGAIFSILPLLALRYFYPLGIPLIGIVGAFGFGATIAAGIMWKLLNRQCWRLTDTELIGGMRAKTRLPLSSLEKIVIGLPRKFLFPGAERIIPSQVRAESLLLCFADGSLLPMNLHDVPNGTALMNALVSRFAERVDRQHTYSQEEANVLWWAQVNVVIKAK